MIKITKYYGREQGKNFDTCMYAHHYFYTCLTELFAEEYLDIKLYPWQKTMLKMLKGDKINARAASRYISRR